MLGQLIKCIGGVAYDIHPWVEAQRELLVYIDAQIASSWEEFHIMTDYIIDDLQCTRAGEDPEDDSGIWTVSIPHCKPNNTKCAIRSFMNTFLDQLKVLVSGLSSRDRSTLTEELRQILATAQETINQGKFPFEGRTCRSVADLIIGLQSIHTKALVSSNYKEHQILHKFLGYHFLQFPLAAIRSK
jgi:hypothetical protein